MENKKITEFVHVDESNEEKMSAKITIQSFKDEIKEIDVPKGIVTFLGSKNGKRIPYLTKNRYSVSDLVHCQRKSLYKQLGLKPEQLVQDLILEVKKHCSVFIEEIVLTKENVTFKLPSSLN